MIHLNPFHLTEKEFSLYDLSPQDQNMLYAEFKDSYVKATGAAWDEDKFQSRARNWIFFGSEKGGVAVRIQNSGLIKLNASFGSFKEIFRGFHELLQKKGSSPIWGAVTDDIAKMLEKGSHGDFQRAPAMFVKMAIPFMKSVFGNEIKKVNSDGSLSIETPSGVMKKYFVANKEYYRWVVDGIKSGKSPIKLPSIVLNLLVKIAGIGQ